VWLRDRPTGPSSASCSRCLRQPLGLELVQLNQNHAVSELNFFTVLQDRILNSDQRFAWFFAHGMPADQSMREDLSYIYREDLGSELLDYLQLPEGQQPTSAMLHGGLPLAKWVREDSMSTYGWFILSHPDDTLERVKELATSTLNPDDAGLLPLNNRALVPRFLFGSWQWWTLGAVASLFYLQWRRVRSRVAAVVGVGLATCAVWYSLIVVTSGIEHPLHVITVAVALRVVSLIAIVEALSTLATTSNEVETSVEPVA